jgi:Leucine-rich repeat (LRR) protein
MEQAIFEFAFWIRDVNAAIITLQAAMDDYVPCFIITVRTREFHACEDYLDLSDMGLVGADIQELHFMVNLETLKLQNNNIDFFDSFGRPGSMPYLTYLDFSNNNLKGVSRLACLPSLEWLDLSNNEIETLTGQFGNLGSLPNLKWLDLSNNNLQGITDLTGLPSIERLDLSNNIINNIGTFGSPGSAPNLTYLDLSGNRLLSGGGLMGLTNLRILKLCNNRPNGTGQLSSLWELREMIWLEELYVSNNNIGSTGGGINQINGLINLRVLDLSHNSVANTVPLADMIKLERLYLSNNQVTNLTGLQNLWSMQYIDLQNNNPIITLMDLSGIVMSFWSTGRIPPIIDYN